MADVTISGLSEGLPNKNSAIIPYSDGSTTYKTSPSGIVAASPGSIINISNILNETAYTFTVPSNTSYVDTGMSVNYKPLYNTSKILIQAHIYAQGTWNSLGYNIPLVLQMRRGLNTNLTNFVGGKAIASNGEYDMGTYSFSVMDNANTTDTITYNFFAKTWYNGSGGTAYINRSIGFAGPWTSMFTFFEIAG